VAAPLQHAIEDGSLGEIGVVQHAAPGGERLVGGEDHSRLLPRSVTPVTVDEAHAKEAAVEVALIRIQEYVYWYSVREA
jgi:hypothetical protein